ncbi:hypothetical protein RJ639_019491 [Escallonia herrerae]|uniref:Uncharacterized protein n=1 Tax=Escallonia herrerae TaxID=1293975 RepID=A0AA88VA25_9ASTE|nr:hypothetical protein RJ639_019491 [Escallonia herrerae]
MEKEDATSLVVENVESGKPEGDVVKVDDYKHRTDELFFKVEKLEQKVDEVEQFYLTTSEKHSNISKHYSKDKDKHVPSIKKQQQDASRREAAAAKRMQDLMRQFGTILRQAITYSLPCFSAPTSNSSHVCVEIVQPFRYELDEITQHKWAWPFMQPVDVEGLELHDYYAVIDRPMDFSTIKNQMEAKDGTGYKHVRELHADVKLIFDNAMKYNDESSDVHNMAKTLLEKFEEKWLQLLPRVTEEEKRREEEEAEAQLKVQLAHEAAHSRMARDLSNELYEVTMQLEELRGSVVQKCRKMSMEEKRKLGISLSQLCPEDLSKVLEIVAQSNPSFQASALEVDLDIDAQVMI